MFKKILMTSLFTSLVALPTYAEQQTETEKNENFFIVSGAFTELNDFSGQGFKISSRLNFSEFFDNTNAPLSLYGQLNYASSQDEQKNSTLYFEEIELVLGINYSLNEDYQLFFEAGDLKQVMEQGNNTLWQDHGSIYRSGFNINHNDFDISIALEHRDGIKSDTGYSARYSMFDGKMAIGFTDVGDYKLLEFSVVHRF